MRNDNLDFLDATAMADHVRRGDIRPIELVEASIARIERLNPVINAVVVTCFESARNRALNPPFEGPFAGVPFLLKDLGIEMAGLATTAGSAFLRHAVPDQDDERVTRLKRAGLIILGKTNTPELGLRPTTEPRLFGPCRNPWDPGRTAGGSSGGAAAAVAAGFVPMAHGNDGGGSIRIPASCCGVFGFKPSRTRNGPGDGAGGAVHHVLTRSIRDGATLLDAVSPRVPSGDPESSDFRTSGAMRLRIAWSTTAPTGIPIHEECVRAVHEAVRLCDALGHITIEAAPAIDGERMIRAMDMRAASGLYRRLETLVGIVGRRPAPDELEPLTWALNDVGRGITPERELQAAADLDDVSFEIERFFDRFDVWLHPTLSEPSPVLGSFDASPDRLLDGWARGWAFNPFLALCNLTGRPGMSVPLHWTREGLPVGVHFAGIEGEDSTLFRLAAQLEAARPWAHRRPSLVRD